ncbi:hypothetical protein ADUPG1_009759, partial [Aduncisulcus paluster]
KKESKRIDITEKLSCIDNFLDLGAIHKFIFPQEPHKQSKLILLSSDKQDTIQSSSLFADVSALFVCILNRICALDPINPPKKIACSIVVDTLVLVLSRDNIEILSTSSDELISHPSKFSDPIITTLSIAKPPTKRQAASLSSRKGRTIRSIPQPTLLPPLVSLSKDCVLLLRVLSDIRLPSRFVVGHRNHITIFKKILKCRNDEVLKDIIDDLDVSI